MFGPGYPSGGFEEKENLELGWEGSGMIMSKRWYKVTGVGILTVSTILIAVVYWLAKGHTAYENVERTESQAIAKRTAEHSPEVAGQPQEEAAVEASRRPADAPKARKSRSLRRPRPRRPEPMRFDESRRESPDSG